MMEIKFPYGKEFLSANFDESRLNGILVSDLHSYKTDKSGTELVREAMANPVGSPKLSELAKGKNFAGIAVVADVLAAAGAVDDTFKAFYIGEGGGGARDSAFTVHRKGQVAVAENGRKVGRIVLNAAVYHKITPFKQVFHKTRIMYIQKTRISYCQKSLVAL